jgi:hypothetical protein
MMTALISASTKVARAEGLTVEAYPIDTSVPTATRNRFSGVLETFLCAGFTEVKRIASDRAVVRFPG